MSWLLDYGDASPNVAADLVLQAKVTRLEARENVLTQWVRDCLRVLGTSSALPISLREQGEKLLLDPR